MNQPFNAEQFSWHVSFQLVQFRDVMLRETVVGTLTPTDIVNSLLF